MKINFGKMMLQSAKQFSEKEAIVNMERNRRLTYMELHLLTNKICNMMRDKFKLGFDNVYILLLENDNTSLFSLWMAKGAAAGGWLNYRDSIDEHTWQIDYIKPKLIFMETVLVEKYHSMLRERNVDIICMDKPEKTLEGVYYFWDLMEKSVDDETGIEYEDDEYIIFYRFTGGTTGKGKCAMYTIRNMLAARDQFYGQSDDLITSTSRHLHITPLTHASACAMLPVFFKGGTNVTMNAADLKYMCEIIQEEKIKSSFVVPTLLYWLIDAGLEKKYDLSSLSVLMYGAAPMSPSKLKNLQAIFGNIFIQAYGSTEAFPPILILGRQEHAVETKDDEKRLSAAGSPLPGIEVKICDEDGREIKNKDIGEIWIRSAAVIKGYYNNPEGTAKEFEDGFWKSGDMGYCDEKNYIYIVDRKKDMIITGGFNVYAIEVENTLNSHSAIAQSAVVGIPHEEWGEAIHAEIILKKDAKVTKEELKEYCKKKIGRYKAPKTISFVNELPLTVVGKVLRRNIREKYWKDDQRKIN